MLGKPAQHDNHGASHTPGLIGINNNDIDPAGWAKADPSANVPEDDTGSRGVDLVIGGRRIKRYGQPYYYEQEYISGGEWVSSTHFQNRHANAARIAACWNAAERAGLSTEALNEGVVEELLRFARNIFNGLDTGMIRMETPADETLEKVLRRGRAAISKALRQ